MPGWYDQVGGLFLDGDEGGIGANLGDVIWWTLMGVALGPCPWACSAPPPAPERDAGGPRAHRP